MHSRRYQIRGSQIYLKILGYLIVVTRFLKFTLACKHVSIKDKLLLFKCFIQANCYWWLDWVAAVSGSAIKTGWKSFK